MNLSNLKKVFSVCDFGNKKIIYFLGFKISHKSKINDVSCRLQKIENKFKKFDLSNKYFPDFTISSLEVHIAEHCNLNCQCCNHYSPLAKEEFLDINIFEKDLNRLSQLTNGNISYLKLLGGEPLLCPNLIDYFQTARKYFPNSNIVLMTNAILLNKCDDNFYEALRKYDIEICLTKYPLKIDFKAIEKKFKKEKCKLTQIGINKKIINKKNRYLNFFISSPFHYFNIKLKKKKVNTFFFTLFINS